MQALIFFLKKEENSATFLLYVVSKVYECAYRLSTTSKHDRSLHSLDIISFVTKAPHKQKLKQFSTMIWCLPAIPREERKDLR